MTMTPAEWWQNLAPRTRDRLRDNPRGPVPADLARDIARAGGSLWAAWWPSVQDGPGAFHLPGELAQYIEGLRELEWSEVDGVLTAASDRGTFLIDTDPLNPGAFRLSREGGGRRRASGGPFATVEDAQRRAQRVYESHDEVP